MEELKCPICGEDTVIYYGNPQKYGLCAYHSKQLKEGEIEIREEYNTRIFLGKQNLLQKITGNDNIIGLQPLENKKAKKRIYNKARSNISKNARQTTNNNYR